MMSRRDVIAAGSLLPVAAAAGVTPTSDLADLGAIEAAARIRDGALTAEAYAQALIARQQALAHLHVAINFDADRVLEQARSIDQARAKGAKLGRLAGVPFVAKDQIEIQSWHTTVGTPALADYVSPRTNPVAAAMLAEGAIVFAKANMHELASGGTSANPTFGAVGNPYDPERGPGGSSGGTAAALAARIVPIGLGEDTGGSVRIPAGLCGVVGLRPSTWPAKAYSDLGMVPPPEPDDAQTIGPMARSVADVVLLHQIVTGQKPRVPTDLRGLRLGVPRPDFWEQPFVDRDVAAAVHIALDRLAAAGAVLVAADMEQLRALGTELTPIVASGNRARFVAWLAENRPGLTLDALVERIASADARASYLMPVPPSDPAMTPERRLALRHDAGARYAAFFRDQGIEAVAFPNPLYTAARIPTDNPLGPTIEANGRSFPQRDVALRYDIFGSRLGAPGLNIPAGMSEGLPVGIEFTALPGEDARLLALGAAAERLWGPLPPPRL